MAQIYNESKMSVFHSQQSAAVVIRGNQPLREVSLKENLHPNVMTQDEDLKPRMYPFAAVVPPTYHRY